MDDEQSTQALPASGTEADAETKQCPYCAERILAAAKVCRYCQRDLSPPPPPPPKSGIGKKIGIGALIVFGGFVLIVIYGSTLGPGDFNGTNHTLYSAIAVYGAALTNDEADKRVGEIMEGANVSHSQAERMAVVFVQNHIDPSLWAKLADTSVRMQKLQDQGVIPSDSP